MSMPAADRKKAVDFLPFLCFNIVLIYIKESWFARTGALNIKAPPRLRIMRSS